MWAVIVAIICGFTLFVLPPAALITNILFVVSSKWCMQWNTTLEVFYGIFWMNILVSGYDTLLLYSIFGLMNLSYGHQVHKYILALSWGVNMAVIIFLGVMAAYFYISIVFEEKYKELEKKPWYSIAKKLVLAAIIAFPFLIGLPIILANPSLSNSKTANMFTYYFRVANRILLQGTMISLIAMYSHILWIIQKKLGGENVIDMEVRLRDVSVSILVTVVYYLFTLPRSIQDHFDFYHPAWYFMYFLLIMGWTFVIPLVLRASVQEIYEGFGRMWFVWKWKCRGFCCRRINQPLTEDLEEQ